MSVLCQKEKSENKMSSIQDMINLEVVEFKSLLLDSSQ